MSSEPAERRPEQRQYALAEGVCEGDGFRLTGGSLLGFADTSALDHRVITHMTDLAIPNGSVAVMSADGRLVYARGFTNCAYQHRSGGVVSITAAGGVERGFYPFLAQPDSSYRIGSISKMLTATAVVKLMDRRFGAPFSLSTPIWTLMGSAYFPGANMFGPLRDLTIQDLLSHRGVWCRDAKEFAYRALTGTCLPGYDFAGHDDEVALGLGLNFPLSIADFRTWWATLRTSFAPGTVYFYSNTDYLLLAEVVSAFGGMSYADYVETNILLPLGMVNTYPAPTRGVLRRAGEVWHYGQSWPLPPSMAHLFNATELAGLASYRRSVLTPAPDVRSPVGRTAAYDAYGGRYNLAVGLAPGGWASTVVDLCRLARALFQDDGGGILSASWARSMARDHYGEGRYGLGVTLGNNTREHHGSLPGAAHSLLVHDANGVVLCYLFNRSLPDVEQGEPKPDTPLRTDLAATIGAAGVIPTSGDLFGSYP